MSTDLFLYFFLEHYCIDSHRCQPSGVVRNIPEFKEENKLLLPREAVYGIGLEWNLGFSQQVYYLILIMYTFRMTLFSIKICPASFIND